jgi:cytochrome c biogenesis protein CcdA
VYLFGGIVIALGPGQLLVTLVPHPGRHLSYVLEIVAGVAMLTAAAFFWGYRDRLGKRQMGGEMKIERRSSVLLGATITAVELPTAFPYFAAIAAIVGSYDGIVQQIILLVVFNLCFVAPLLVILAILEFARDDAQRVLTDLRTRLEAHWPQVVAVLALVAGVFVTLLGATGLASLHRNDFGTFARHVRHFLKP